MLLAVVGVRVFRLTGQVFTNAFSQAIAFVIGFVRQDITLALYVGLGGTALAFVLIVPPWPFFNRNPVPWLPVGGRGAGSQQAAGGIVVNGKHVTT